METLKLEKRLFLRLKTALKMDDKARFLIEVIRDKEKMTDNFYRILFAEGFETLHKYFSVMEIYKVLPVLNRLAKLI